LEVGGICLSRQGKISGMLAANLGILDLGRVRVGVSISTEYETF
jgi:hypothetical protein